MSKAHHVRITNMMFDANVNITEVTMIPIARMRTITISNRFLKS